MNVQCDMSLCLLRPLSPSEQQRKEGHEMASKGFSGSDWLVPQSTETLLTCELFA